MRVRNRVGLGILGMALALFFIAELSPSDAFARRRKGRRQVKPVATKRVAPAKKKTPEPDQQPAAAPAAPGGPGEEVQPAGALQRGARVEFDGRLVQGQTAKSGAIYLFARKRAELRSMVQERTNYRREILRTVYSKFDER